MLTAVYAGTFDPVTLGHMDIIERAERIYDRVVVATTDNTGKNSWFSLDERLAMLREALAPRPGIRVESFGGLLVDYAGSVGANVIVRGLRAAGDFEYEFGMAMVNRSMAPQIETVFFVSSAEYMFVTSSLIRSIAQAGGDVSPFVPESARNAIIHKLASFDKGR